MSWMRFRRQAHLNEMSTLLDVLERICADYCCEYSDNDCPFNNGGKCLKKFAEERLQEEQAKVK